MVGLLLRLLSFAMVAIIAGSGWIYVSAPVEGLRTKISYTPPDSTITRDIGLGAANHLRIEDIPVSMVLMTMLCEDREFPLHHGITPSRISMQVQKAWEENTPVNSVSTLTQQLAKNVFAGNARSLYRKYIEMLYAFKIERHFTKAEIFTLYADMAQTGDGLYGYKKAAEYYFNKKLSELTLAEQGFIVGILPSPVKYTKLFPEEKKSRDINRQLRFAIGQTLTYMPMLSKNKVDVRDTSNFIAELAVKKIDLTWHETSYEASVEAYWLIRDFWKRYAQH